MKKTSAMILALMVSMGMWAANTPQIVSSQVRANDPTVLDVVYKVVSDKATVNVRALAFEDGERSFRKVVRPETFVNDPDGNPTAQNIGDNIVANVEHKLAWKVSADWATRLAKVKFEVLALDGDLLPLKLRTIPASDQYGKMQISRNAITDAQVFDVLLWLYADKDAGLTLADGELRIGSTKLASGPGLPSLSKRIAIRYVYSKMGFSLLDGVALDYANQETRLGLSPSGARQYGYRIVGE